MLIYSMSTSVDGFVTDGDGDIAWTAPSDELFAFHLDRVRELDVHLCGRRLYETMLPWETDASLSATPLGAQFAAAWAALPKVVFSRTLRSVEGNATLARASLTEELAALGVTDHRRTAEIGGAELAGQAMRLGLVDELRLFRVPVVVGAGRPYLPAGLDLSLDLVATSTFGSVVYERYRRAD